MARTSIIGPTSIVIGNLSGRGDLEIAGRVQGDVDVLGLVQVREEGTVLGSIRAQDVRVAGHATLVLQAGANVQGELIAARLGIEEGARIHGSVRTETPEATSEEPRLTADAAPAPDTGAADGAERQRAQRPRTPAPHPGPAPVAPTPPRAPAQRHSSARSVELERSPPDSEKRGGPPMPVVPALAKGARAKRRLSRT